METKSVYLKDLSGILGSIKERKMPVKIHNHSGQWSEHFFGVLEIKEIREKDYHVTVLILFDPETNDSTALDLKTINMVELQSAMNFDGIAVKKLKVHK